MDDRPSRTAVLELDIVGPVDRTASLDPVQRMIAEHGREVQADLSMLVVALPNPWIFWIFERDLGPSREPE